jgi:hypothetical protein
MLEGALTFILHVIDVCCCLHFINDLRAAFMHTKNTLELLVFYVLLGSAPAKVALKRLIKLTLNVNFTYILQGTFFV